MFFLWNRILSC